jgi:hypothetical protein
MSLWPWCAANLKDKLASQCGKSPANSYRPISYLQLNNNLLTNGNIMDAGAAPIVVAAPPVDAPVPRVAAPVLYLPRAAALVAARRAAPRIAPRIALAGGTGTSTVLSHLAAEHSHARGILGFFTIKTLRNVLTHVCREFRDAILHAGSRVRDELDDPHAKSFCLRLAGVGDKRTDVAAGPAMIYDFVDNIFCFLTFKDGRAIARVCHELEREVHWFRWPKVVDVRAMIDSFQRDHNKTLFEARVIITAYLVSGGGGWNHMSRAEAIAHVRASLSNTYD